MDILIKIFVALSALIISGAIITGIIYAFIDSFAFGMITLVIVAILTVTSILISAD